MKEEDETVFEYFQRGEIEYLQAMNDVLSERNEMLEEMARKIISYEYVAILEKQRKVIDNYRIFLDEFKGVEMYLDEINKATTTTPKAKR
ncbi:hypothetical protein [Pseudomonas sp. FSL R10-2245]|uniref:hypothetical protein n=1 Tax=Pseudomonas TaxID=286 RepID=UPI0012962FC1|nr:hypothetical protein [Pseudomonas sp. FSL R10-2245]MDU7556527.1 hypothetical protein [Pseudomonas sp.]MQU01782.1 hypothetical protein [Pseudomonas sp. FSL R10-2245]